MMNHSKFLWVLVIAVLSGLWFLHTNLMDDDVGNNLLHTDQPHYLASEVSSIVILGESRDMPLAVSSKPKDIFEIGVPVHGADSRLRKFIQDAALSIREYYQKFPPDVQFRIRLTRGYDGEIDSTDFRNELMMILNQNQLGKNQTTHKDFPSSIPQVQLYFLKPESNTTFSRSRACNLLMQEACPTSGEELNSSCTFSILDVDMIFEPSFVDRARRFLRSSSIYYPIVFCEYEKTAIQVAEKIFGPLGQSHHTGRFAIHGYGMVAMRGSVTKEIFYDQNMTGWGGEDTDFHKRSIELYKVARRSEPGLIHEYHEKSCRLGSTTQNVGNQKNCIKAKIRLMGSPLVQWLLQTHGPPFVQHLLIKHTPITARSMAEAAFRLNTQYFKYWQTKIAPRNEELARRVLSYLEKPYFQIGDRIRYNDLDPKWTNGPRWPDGRSFVLMNDPYLIRNQWFLELQPRLRVKWQPYLFRREGVLIAIESSQAHLETRVREGALQTWAKDLPSNVHVVFFVGEVLVGNETKQEENLQNRLEEKAGIAQWNKGHSGNYSHSPWPQVPQISLVVLKNVTDNEYPPIRKNAQLLQRLVTVVKEREWASPEWIFPFVFKGDDNTYINVDKLLEALSLINRKKRAEGQMEYYGKKEMEESQDVNVLKQSGLKIQPSCMGGPGYLMNKLTLTRTAAGMDDCLQKLESFVSQHNGTSHAKSAWQTDTLVGMCVYFMNGIGCKEKRNGESPTMNFRHLPMDKKIQMNEEEIKASISIHPWNY